MRALCVCAAAFMHAAGACLADTFCAELERLASPQAEHTITLGGDPPVCRPSLALSGGRHIHCSWSFAYRSGAAAAAFEALTEAVAHCLGADATLTVDRAVNHPDAYDLRMFDLAGREFAVSRKDKGALQQTLVFVRVEQR